MSPFLLIVTLLLLLLQTASASSIGDRVQANFFALVDMPLNTTSAAEEGWEKVGGDDAPCSALYGHRYRRGGRLSPTMLFDHLGQVAGIQFAVDTSVLPMYPSSSIKAEQWFEEAPGSDVRVLTAHTSDPATLCAGAAALPPGSVGDRVWSRESELGNEAEHFYPLPLRRGDMGPSEGWVASGCMLSGDFPGLSGNGMGQHYWRYAHHAMRSTDFYPWFLLFDQNDELNMFGVSISGPVPRWPTPSGQMDLSWNEDKVAVDPPRMWQYPHAQERELWTYPTSPLVPFFHFADVLPLNSIYMNTLDADKPCGMFATSTMHVVLKDSSNVTAGACAPGTSREPFNYSQSFAGDAPGQYDLRKACEAEVWLAGGGAPPHHPADGDGPDRWAAACAVLSVLLAAALCVAGWLALRVSRLKQPGARRAGSEALLQYE